MTSVVDNVHSFNINILKPNTLILSRFPRALEAEGKCQCAFPVEGNSKLFPQHAVFHKMG